MVGLFKRIGTYTHRNTMNTKRYNWGVLLPLTNETRFDLDSAGRIPVSVLTLWTEHIRPVTVSMTLHQSSLLNIQFITRLKPNSCTDLADSTQQKLIVLIHMHKTQMHFSKYVLNGTHWLLVMNIPWSESPLLHHCQGQSCSSEVTTVFMVTHYHYQTSLISIQHNLLAVMVGKISTLN